MYAIVDIAGQQFKVEKDQKLFVHRLEEEEGKKVTFDQVLLLDTGSKVSVGDPVVKGAAVSATVLAHVKGDKVLVFKKKRRKGFKKLNGHRQYMTQIQIESISEKATPKSEAAPKKEAAKKKETAPKAEAAPKKEAAPKAEKKPEDKSSS
jgi:large subunit ribosomal protein L21